MCGSLNCGELGQREKWCHGHFGGACVFNRMPCPPGPDVLSSLGVWNGAYLGIWHDFLHELTLKCFPGSFWDFLAWLSVTMQAEACFSVHMLFSHSAFLSLSLPGPTTLYPSPLSIIGDYGDFSVDYRLNHLPFCSRSTSQCLFWAWEISD